MNPSKKPFAIIEKDGNVTEYSGDLLKFTSITEMQEYVKNNIFQALIFMNPFHTIREREGDYEAHGDEPILALCVDEIVSTTREKILENIPDTIIELEKKLLPLLTNSEYSNIVQEIITSEIRG